MAITPLPKTPNVDSGVSKSLWDWLIKTGNKTNQLVEHINNLKSNNAFGNIDGGKPDSDYTGVSSIDLGGVS